MILAYTPKRKGGKRHIQIRDNDIEKLRKYGSLMNKKKYNVEIYNNDWSLVEVIK